MHISNYKKCITVCAHKDNRIRKPAIARESQGAFAVNTQRSTISHVSVRDVHLMHRASEIRTALTPSLTQTPGDGSWGSLESEETSSEAESDYADPTSSNFASPDCSLSNGTHDLLRESTSVCNPDAV